MVELLKLVLSLLELFLRLVDGALDLLKGLAVIRFVGRARLIFPSSEVLDLLTRIFDFCQTERGRRAFEEVA